MKLSSPRITQQKKKAIDGVFYYQSHHTSIAQVQLDLYFPSLLVSSVAMLAMLLDNKSTNAVWLFILFFIFFLLTHHLLAPFYLEHHDAGLVPPQLNHKEHNLFLFLPLLVVVPVVHLLLLLISLATINTNIVITI